MKKSKSYLGGSAPNSNELVFRDGPAKLYKKDKEFKGTAPIICVQSIFVMLTLAVLELINKPHQKNIHLNIKSQP